MLPEFTNVNRSDVVPIGVQNREERGGRQCRLGELRMGGCALQAASASAAPEALHRERLP